MNTVQVRQKIKSKLDQLSPEKLALVSDFIDSIQVNSIPLAESIDLSSLHQLSPIKRGKTALRVLALQQ